MRDGVGAVLLAFLVLAALVCTIWGIGERGLPLSASVEGAEKEKTKPGGLPPLVVDKRAPLRLEEPPEEDPYGVPTGPVADNSACFVCHTNYEEEPFAVEHAKANVGCMKCHGASLDHRDDEDNVTPPDVMFPPEKIEANCVKCHEEHDVPAVEVIARWQQRCPAKTDPKMIVCMDCHGQHRLKVRTVRWDKKTGKLIVRPQDQQPKVVSDLTTKTPKKGTQEATDPDSEMH